MCTCRLIVQNCHKVAIARLTGPLQPPQSFCCRLHTCCRCWSTPTAVCNRASTVVPVPCAAAGPAMAAAVAEPSHGCNNGAYGPRCCCCAICCCWLLRRPRSGTQPRLRPRCPARKTCPAVAATTAAAPGVPSRLHATTPTPPAVVHVQHAAADAPAVPR